jgi:predicted nucleic acid-binding protein
VARPSSDVGDAAWRLAEDLGWAKTYDAEYVALAQRLDSPLASIDARLRRGAGHVVRVRGPSEL